MSEALQKQWFGGCMEADRPAHRPSARGGGGGPFQKKKKNLEASLAKPRPMGVPLPHIYIYIPTAIFRLLIEFWLREKDNKQLWIRIF